MTKDVDLFSKIKLKALLMSGASFLALIPHAYGQEQVGVVSDDDEDEETLDLSVVRVTGIRGSLKDAMDIKRYAQGVVDSISAEDMGKFPDTNLAESLQRISGVSIDRRRGEGSRVTVRGFGPSFNMVTLNGRQVATAYAEGGSIPTSRDFDFSTIASDMLGGVDVYKTNQVAIPTGGIGASIDVKTLRPLDQPGRRFVLNLKGIADSSVTTLGSETVSPDVTALYHDTFVDDTVGIALSLSVHHRALGVAEAGVTDGYRGFFRGNESNWGSLPVSPNDNQITNRPGQTQIYGTPQSMRYILNDVSNERTNAGIVLQYRPNSNVTATVDYFSSEQKTETYRSELSVWFNHGNTTSAWGDGPIADILYYNEAFNTNPDVPPSEITMGAVQTAMLLESEVLGFNLEFESTDGFSLVLDAQTSTAEGRPDSPYGSAGVASTADHSLDFQGVDFRSDLPVLSLGFIDPHIDIDSSRMIATGANFHSAYISTSVEEFKLEGSYEFDSSLFKSVTFGVSTNQNDYRGTHSVNQRDTWSGVGKPSDYPDDIWVRKNLASNYDQMSGSERTFQEFYAIDFPKFIKTIDSDIMGTDADGNPTVLASAICGGDGNCINDELVQNDYRTSEETLVAYFQFDAGVTVDNWKANLVPGIRLERTTVESEGLVGVPSGTAWVAENEFYLQGLTEQANRAFTKLDGSYEYALPIIGLTLAHKDNYVLRAAWGKTLTRPSYQDIRGGQSVERIFRVNGGSGSSGNPDLKPYVSTNTDISSEWYYGDDSYLSVAFFAKKVENFIGTTQKVESPFEVYTPIGGRRYQDALAALGVSAAGNAAAIRKWIFENADASTFNITERRDDGTIVGEIYGVPGEDPRLSFRISIPINAETKNVEGWELSWQHFFGDSGFGVLANYTIVDGDGIFNNHIVPSDNARPTPIEGISDSYNLVGLYEKDGMQVRIAYNWRDRFLTSTTGFNGDPDNPVYVEAYGQFDFATSYVIADQFTVFLEGINVTNETTRQVGRSSSYVYRVEQNGPRYFFGVRYSF